MGMGIAIFIRFPYSRRIEKLSSFKNFMDALGIIPARYESTRFPGKPLAQILGKSLIQRTYENALTCKDLAEIVVATDDERIYDHVKSFQGQVVMTSRECLTGTDRIGEVLTRYPSYQRYSLTVNIQGDEPCLDPEMVSLLVRALEETDGAVMATPIGVLADEKEAFHPSIVKCVVDQSFYALYFSRALIPSGRSGAFHPHVTYYRHIGLYAYRTPFLIRYKDLSPTPLQLAEDLEQLKVIEHGFRIKAVLVTTPFFLEVNHPEDIQKVERYLCKQNSSL